MTLPNQDVRLGITNLYLNQEIDEEWDIVIDENGQLVTVTGQEYIIQKLLQLFRTNSGEVITNTEYGIPYMTEILGVKNPDLAIIRNLFVDAVMSNKTLIDLGVTKCDISDVFLDSSTRNLTVSGMTILTKYSTINIEDFAI